VTCAFCGSACELVCTFPISKTVAVLPAQLVAGDKIQYALRKHETFDVLAVDTFDVNGQIFSIETTRRLKTGRVIRESFRRLACDAVPVIRLAPCARPCCDLHMREPWDDGAHVVCCEHWNADA
jgi:hypothetical protein